MSSLNSFDRTCRSEELDLVPVCELQVFLAAYSAVERYPCVCGARFGVVLLSVQEGRIDAPEKSEPESKAEQCDEDPVVAQPENELDVVAVPAVAQVVGEEAPGMVVVLVWEENAQTVHALRVRVAVVSPDQAEVQRSGRSHDGNVWEHPSAVVVGQRVDGLEEERVAGNRAHGVVGNASGDSAAHPCGIGEEGVEFAIAPLYSVSRVKGCQASHIHRPGQCKFHQSGGGQSIEWHRHAESGSDTRQTSPRTTDIQRR
jgi:hypothetical protein